MASTDKITKMKALFCSKLNDFTQDMRVVLKGDSEADTIFSALEALVSMSPDLVIKFFRSEIAIPYEAQIIGKDETFLKSEINDKLSGESNGLLGPMENLHHKIGERWDSMNDKQKNMIWDYFKILVVLAKRL